MSKLLLYTDNHFCSTSSILRKRGERYTYRLENQLDTMNWLMDTAKKYNCYEMCCLGDFFDSNRMSAEEISALSEIKFDNNINQHFIVGNHEMGNAALEYSTAHAFLMSENCEVYNKPSIIGVGNTLFYILPYQVENNREEKIMNYFPTIDTTGKYKVLLMHNDIKGIQMGKFLSKEGFAIDDLSQNFDLVVNGHLHNQMWVAKNVLNLGNITGQNFSEDGFQYPHQAMILDCDTLTYELINNPKALNFYKIDFVSNSDIDYINMISSKIHNAVLSIKVLPEDAHYIKYRFDPDYNPPDCVTLMPKNCNTVQTRVVIESPQTDLSSNIENSRQTFQMDHKREFEYYIHQTIGTSDIIVSELQEVLK